MKLRLIAATVAVLAVASVPATFAATHGTLASQSHIAAMKKMAGKKMAGKKMMGKKMMMKKKAM